MDENSKEKTSKKENRFDNKEVKEDNRQGLGKTIISDIIFFIGLILMVAVVAVLSRGAGGLGGYHFYEVLTSSMESVYPKGSLVIVKTVDPRELMVGDDITFFRNIGAPITHRIVEIKEEYEGITKRAFVTKGVDNVMADADPVLEDNVIGKVIISIPFMGVALSWMRSNVDIVISAFLALMIGSALIKRLWRSIRRRKEKSFSGVDK